MTGLAEELDLDRIFGDVLVEAGRCFINELRTLGPGDGMPVDEGDLRRGIVETERDFNELSLVIESVATSVKGVDYPAIQNAGYPGKWEGWWDDVVANNQALWDRCVEEASVAAGLI